VNKRRQMKKTVPEPIRIPKFCNTLIRVEIDFGKSQHTIHVFEKE
jgi:hypothetical protein